MVSPCALQVAAIFAFVAGFYDKLIQKPHIHVFQFMYYFSSFWALYGSHTTSFLLAAEVTRGSYRQLLDLTLLVI